jgi:hypothetical protein
VLLRKVGYNLRVGEQKFGECSQLLKYSDRLKDDNRTVDLRLRAAKLLLLLKATVGLSRANKQHVLCILEGATHQI